MVRRKRVACGAVGPGAARALASRCSVASVATKGALQQLALVRKQAAERASQAKHPKVGIPYLLIPEKQE